MRCSVALGVVLAAGAATSVFGQAVPAPVFVQESPVRLEINSVNGVPFTAQPVITNRAVELTYDNLTGRCANFLMGAAAGVDDVSFAPGPWATTSNNLITALSFRIGITQAVNARPFDVIIGIYNTGDFAAANIPGDVIARFRVGFNPITTAGAGLFVGNLPLDQFFPETGGIIIPDGDIFVEQVFTAPGGNVPLANGDVFTLAAAVVNGGVTLGSTEDDYSLDFAAPFQTYTGGVTADQFNINAPPAGINSERFIFTAPASACGTQVLQMPLSISGETGTPIPATPIALGSIADAGLNRLTETLNNDIKFYTFTLAGDATDAALQFLDVDTEGSATDVSMALYYANGRLAGRNTGVGNSAIDDNDGSGNNALLTYGIGRRAAVSDGTQYDGRDGQLFAGDFVLAVGPGGSLFDQNFTTFPGAGAGNFQLHFRTNTNGAALTPSVPPLVVQDLGQILSPGNTTATTAQTGPGGIVWYKFDVCAGMRDPGTFFDIDLSRSGFFGGAVPNFGTAALFDANGNLVDADGPDSVDIVWPTLSYGNVGPRPAHSGNAAEVNNTGQDGALGPGTYYLAVASGFLDVSPAALADGRWHVRPDIAETVDVVVQPDFFTDAAQCDPTPVAPPAFNFTEAEPNNDKATATLAAGMSNGQILGGVTTGIIAERAAPGTPDFWRIRTAPAALGIYRHQLELNTNGWDGHGSAIMGLAQANGVITADDAIVQLAQILEDLNRRTVWYGFGRQEEIFWQVQGSPSTTAPYFATLTTTQVSPTSLGAAFEAGDITITTVGQTGAAQTDSDLWIYDSNLEAIAGAGSDDAGASTGSTLTRNLGAGTYFLALTNFNLANNQASPVADGFPNGNVLDFANAIANSSVTTGLDLGFAITDSTGTRTFTATKDQAHQILWFQMDVSGGACVADVDDGSGNGTPDGAVTIDDLLFYITIFQLGSVNADVDDGSSTGTPDGAVTIDDLLYYLIRFQAGC
ncbi:MAG: hypothetical protein IPK69_11175 [Phycisphaerales bacterium]|nr:MAG: hypothetical protein IPK69_11175 [Phycisphaerales bacterium]